MVWNRSQIKIILFVYQENVLDGAFGEKDKGQASMDFCFQAGDGRIVHRFV